MKNLRHPATIVAALALFVALGGGAAWASGRVAGWNIKNHSISARKLTKSAVKSLHGMRGRRGATGATGATGPTGPAGPAGPQGPGGKILTFDATATSTTPTPTALGTFLGDTLTAACVSDGAGGAELVLGLLTSDGSWDVDYGEVDTTDSTTSSSAGSLAAPAGTITTPLQLTLATAASGGHQDSLQVNAVQLSPSGGSMMWYGMATTTTANPTCHASIEYVPETITALHGAAHATAGSTFHLPLRLGNIPLHLGGR